MAQDRQLQSEREIVRVGLIGQEYFRKSAKYQQADQAFVNCYPEIYRNPTTGEERHVLTKLPKLNSAACNIPSDLNSALGLTATDMTCLATMAMAQMEGVIISAWVDRSTGTVYIYQSLPISGAMVRIGSIAKKAAGTASLSTNDQIWLYECQIDNAGTLLPGITVNRMYYDGSHSSGWYARATSATSFGAASLNQIVAAAYPDQLGTPLVCTGPIIQMNGIFHVITTTGVIYSSNGGTGTPNDPTNWASTAVIQTYQDADRGLALARYKHHILAFSSSSIEFFNDIGNPAPASPLERTEQALVKFGAASGKQIVNVGDTIYWIAGGKYNPNGLWKMDGYTPVKVSTAAQDGIIHNSLASAPYIAQRTLFYYTMGGKTHIGLNGVKFYPEVYHSSTSLRWGTSADTYYTENYHLRVNMVAGVIMFNAEDKVWWYMMIAPGDGSGNGTDGSVYGILPASYTTGPATLSAWNNYTFCYLTQNAPSNNNTSTYRQVGYSIGTGWSSGWSMESGDRTWPFVVQFNTLNFGNLNRKRIHSAELVFANVPTSHTIIEYITLHWDKSNHPTEISGASDLVTTLYGARTMKEPEETAATYQSPAGSLGIMGWPDRYFINNLGMGRYWNFFIVGATQAAFDLEGLDLTVSQCTS